MVCLQLKYFNPRTHVECDVKSSIKGWESDIFQSTHSCRVRRDRPGNWNNFQDFNPRTHVECDRKVLANLLKNGDFNPRTHVECDNPFLLWLCRVEKFQSTHSCRVRPNLVVTYKVLSDFNPRTHVECDSEKIGFWNGHIYFNPRTHVECDAKDAVKV